MKYALIFISAIFYATIGANGQMTVAHSFAKQTGTESEIVNLGISGKKIMTLFNENDINTPDTLYFYNLDYSFWKSIPCPAFPGYTGQFNIFHDLGKDVGVFYPSETLFNLDTFLEVAVVYLKEGGPGGKILIINELGAMVDSIPNIAWTFYPFRVYRLDTLGIGFQAAVSTTSGITIYNLPGTMPCDACSNGFGMAQAGPKSFPTQPLPNPSSNQVKITFTLPEGTTQGELNLYSTTGQKLRSYNVDNRFGYIMLDNSQLSAGLYYYNIVVKGEISSTQKLVVVK